MKRRSIALTVTRTAVVGTMMLTLSLAGCSTTSSKKSDSSTSKPSSKTPSEFSQGDTPAASTSTGAKVSGELGTAYFDFDRSEIREDQRETLRKNAEILKGGGKVIIGGHADERGSEEYNLALGERRAEAVKRYLSALGVSVSSMRVVSYGETKPAVRGHDESAWRWNRRADFTPQ